MPRQGKHHALWPGLLLIFALSLGGALLAGSLDFFEAVHRHTRPYKSYFMDELLFFLPFFLLLGLAVFLYLTNRRLRSETILCQRHEKKLEDLTEQWNIFSRHGPAVFYTANPSGDYGATYMSPNVMDILGYEPEQFLDDPGFWLARVHPEDRERVQASLARLLQEAHLDMHYRFQVANGSYLWIRDQMILQKDGQGQARQIIGYMVDVTQRKRVEEALREAEARYRNVFEGAAEGVLVAEVETRKFLLANPAICQMLGYSEDELRKMSVLEIHPKDSLAHVISEFEAQAHLGKRQAPRLPCLRKDGSIFHADVYAAKAMIDEKECLIGFFIDVSDREQAERALREREKRFKDITHSMADWTWEVDKSGRYTFSSTAAKQILGYEPEEIIGKTPFDLMTPEEAKRIEPIFHGIASQKKPIVDLENWNLNKQGEKVCLLTSGVPLLDENGDLLGYRGVDKDITERKRAEEEIRRHSRHQTAINSILALSQKNMPLPEFLSQALDIILDLPWLTSKKGAVFLTGHPATLTMQAQRGLEEPLIKKCSEVPFGHCLCGQAALGGSWCSLPRWTNAMVSTARGIRPMAIIAYPSAGKARPWASSTCTRPTATTAKSKKRNS